MKPILPKSVVNANGLSQVCGVLTPGTTIILAPPVLRGALGESHQNICLPSPSVTTGLQNVPQPTPIILPLSAAKKSEDQQTSYQKTGKFSKMSTKDSSIKFRKQIVKNILPKVPQVDTRTLIIVPSVVSAFLPSVSIASSCTAKTALKPNGAKKCKVILQKSEESKGNVSVREVHDSKESNNLLIGSEKCSPLITKDLKLKNKGCTKRNKFRKVIDPLKNSKHDVREGIVKVNANLISAAPSRQFSVKCNEQYLPDHAIPHHPPPPYPCLNEPSRNTHREPSKCDHKEKRSSVPREYSVGSSQPHRVSHSNENKPKMPTCLLQQQLHQKVRDSEHKSDSHLNNANISLQENGPVASMHCDNCSITHVTMSPICSASLTEQRYSGHTSIKSRVSSVDPPSYSQHIDFSGNQMPASYAGSNSSGVLQSHTSTLRYNSLSSSNIPSCQKQSSTSYRETMHPNIKRTMVNDSPASVDSSSLQSCSGLLTYTSGIIVSQDNSNSYLTKGTGYPESPHLSNFNSLSQVPYGAQSQASPYSGHVTPTSFSHSPQMSAYVQSPPHLTYVSPSHYGNAIHPSTVSQSSQALCNLPHNSSTYSHLHHYSHRSSQDMSQPDLMQNEFHTSHVMHHSIANSQEYTSSTDQPAYCQSPESFHTKLRHASSNAGSNCQLPLLPSYSLSRVSPPNPCTSKSPSIYSCNQSSHHLHTSNNQQLVGYRDSVPPLTHTYNGEKFSSTYYPSDRSLSPPSYEAHFQNAIPFSNSGQTCAQDTRNKSGSSSNFSSYPHNPRFTEQEFSHMSLNLRDDICSPPSYPTSSSSASIALLPPGYASDPHGHPLKYPFTPDICSDSQEYSSPVDNSSHFFPDTPPLLPPPAAPPPSDNALNISANTSRESNVNQSASSHPMYISNSGNIAAHFESQDYIVQRGLHKNFEPDSYEYHMYGIEDASSNTWKSEDSESTQVHDLIENAEGVWFIPHQEQNKLYIKRKELAKDILKYSASKSSRDNTLKEKFWIEEDEPIADEIVNSVKEENGDIVKQRPSSNKTRDMLCQICGKILKGVNSLKSHLNSHHSIQPHSCPYCSKSFSNRSVLVQHVRIHTGERPYACAICDRVYRTRTALKRHQSFHTNERPFDCSVCSKAFKTKLVLQNHLKLHITGLFTCPICNKTFERQKSYVVHKASHQYKKKKYRCHHCTKSYRFRSLLNYHMQMHTNDRKYVCSICSEAFVWRSGLAAHMKTHSTSRPKCYICGACFSSEKRLDIHIKRHNNKKPHKCEECGLSFAFPYRLSAHKLIHQEHREYSCTKCSMVFSSSKALSKHIFTHENDNLQVTFPDSVRSSDTVDS
ncbi:hypothetical protein SK128_024904 [Halocaridina rubra]|uniref:C2H2-type domain-containing protein n=1 Tax=Halocaridina rubra TaxID=373956 RepID=A0AAN8ZUN2_HALRR